MKLITVLSLLSFLFAYYKFISKLSYVTVKGFSVWPNTAGNFHFYFILETSPLGHSVFLFQSEPTVGLLQYCLPGFHLIFILKIFFTSLLCWTLWFLETKSYLLVFFLVWESPLSRSLLRKSPWEVNFLRPQICNYLSSLFIMNWSVMNFHNKTFLKIVFTLNLEGTVPLFSSFQALLFRSTVPFSFFLSLFFLCLRNCQILPLSWAVLWFWQMHRIAYLPLQSQYTDQFDTLTFWIKSLSLWSFWNPSVCL